MSALTERIAAEHRPSPWPDRPEGAIPFYRCAAGCVGTHLEDEGDTRRHVAEVTEAAVRAAVIDTSVAQSATWLGDKRTLTRGEEPGNDAYMEYVERVLTASGYDDIQWGPALLAIVLDRAVRETEKAIALGIARGTS